MKEKLILTEEWDKTFPKSEKVNHRKVTFHNRYGIMLAADLYEPKSARGKLPAIAVSGPFGAVKEQSSGLYAQTMAERGFLTIAFDPSFSGESGGEPRYVASPDINTEDFQAAVDFLSVRENVDPERIGIIGICGWGGMALNAAAIDTRVRATVTATMYDMTRVTANGYFDACFSLNEIACLIILALHNSGLASPENGSRDEQNLWNRKNPLAHNVNIKYKRGGQLKTDSKSGFVTKKEALPHEADMRNRLENAGYTPFGCEK